MAREFDVSAPPSSEAAPQVPGQPAGPARLRTAYLLILALIAVLAVCVIARAVLIPIAAAVILHAVFAPAVRSLSRRGLAPVISALLLLGSLIAVGSTAAYYLYEPAGVWLSELPKSSAQLAELVREIKRPVQDVVDASEAVEDLANPDEAGVVRVREQPQSLLSIGLNHAYQITVGSLLALALLFLLLANERSFLRGAVRALRRGKDRRRAVRIVQGFQRDISFYLRTITVINLLLGVVVALALWLLDMPNPALWGAMAFALNYVPYIGLAVGSVIVGVAALISFEDPAVALLVPATYAACSLLEGGIITPAVIGNRLLISPPVVLVWLILWGWMWGVAGALLAVPLLMAVKICCEQVPAFRGVALFLSRDARTPPRRPAPRAAAVSAPEGGPAANTVP